MALARGLEEAAQGQTRRARFAAAPVAELEARARRTAEPANDLRRRGAEDAIAALETGVGPGALRADVDDLEAVAPLLDPEPAQPVALRPLRSSAGLRPQAATAD